MHRTVLTGADVFDGLSDSSFTADIVIEGDRIAQIGSGLDGDSEVDLTGKALIPGLFDCHVHVTVSSVDIVEMLNQPFSLQFFLAMLNLKRTLDCGITTVRDAGGADLGVKDAVARGLIEGPDLQISITALGQTGGHTDNWYPCGVTVPAELLQHPGRPDGIVDGVDAMRKKVREVARAGADVIKVCTTGGVLSPRDDPRHSHFSAEELGVLVEEASRLGLWVMAHAQGAAGIKASVRAGVRSIEHGIYLDDEAVNMMQEQGTWLVPTLSAPLAVIAAGETGSQLPPGALDKAKEAVQRHRESFGLATEAGVRIAMGTDSGVGSHGANLGELALMHDYGLSGPAVLKATTSSAAELLGVEEMRGSISVGKLADLVVVEGSPFDFKHLRENIGTVYKHGKPVQIASSDKKEDG
ncbi:MAG: amidohydrolase family protein [Candidatus Dormiibacterota bacterium]